MTRAMKRGDHKVRKFSGLFPECMSLQPKKAKIQKVILQVIRQSSGQFPDPTKKEIFTFTHLVFLYAAYSLKVRLLLEHSCAILISFKIIVIFDTT